MIYINYYLFGIYNKDGSIENHNVNFGGKIDCSDAAPCDKLNDKIYSSYLNANVRKYSRYVETFVKNIVSRYLTSLSRSRA